MVCMTAAVIVPKQEMAAIINDSNNAYHARDKAQSEMMALRQQVFFTFRCTADGASIA